MRQKYVVLPAFGFRSAELAEAKPLAERASVRSLSVMRGAAAPASDDGYEVLSSIGADGPKLVAMTPEAELAMRAALPGLKIVPLFEYDTMQVRPTVDRAAAGVAPAGVGSIELRIVDADGASVPGADVEAFTSVAKGKGAFGTTDRDGKVTLALSPGKKLEQLLVYGPAGYWGYYAKGRKLASGTTIEIAKIDLAVPQQLLARYRGGLPADAGKNVVIAVIDTGVARDHPALPDIAGVNMVSAETEGHPDALDDWGPAKRPQGEHGTHVAGIIAARPTAAAGITGMAPAAMIRSYRVFPHGEAKANSYDIAAAIDRAVSDGCDIVNLSLGGGPADETVRAAIGDALDHGVIVVAAAGNDGRGPVSFPGALPFCIAVSAMGWVGSFPKASTETSKVAKPYGTTDKKSFVASFSNFGPQVDLVGPGVGVISTVPGGYATMNGTSMACPAVAGFAAHLLASDPAIPRERNAERARKLTERLQKAARKVGFGRDYEGFGLPSL